MAGGGVARLVQSTLVGCSASDGRGRYSLEALTPATVRRSGCGGGARLVARIRPDRKPDQTERCARRGCSTRERPACRVRRDGRARPAPADGAPACARSRGSHLIPAPGGGWPGRPAVAPPRPARHRRRRGSGRRRGAAMPTGATAARSSTRAPSSSSHRRRQVDAVEGPVIVLAVLQVVDDLQRVAQRVGRGVAVLRAAVQVEQEAADGSGRAVAVVDQVGPPAYRPLTASCLKAEIRSTQCCVGDAGLEQRPPHGVRLGVSRIVAMRRPGWRPRSRRGGRSSPPAPGRRCRRCRRWRAHRHRTRRHAGEAPPAAGRSRPGSSRTPRPCRTALRRRAPELATAGLATAYPAGTSAGGRRT